MFQNQTRRRLEKLIATSVCLALSVVLNSPNLLLAQSSDWNQFRGPNGSGVSASDSIPKEFGPKQNFVWKTEIPNGFSSPVFASGKIFLTAEDNNKLFTICVDQTNGKELWRKQSPRDREEKLDPRNHPAAPSPVVAGNSVFVFFPDFGLVAYQLDGSEIWRQPLGPFSNLYGMGASPIVIDDRVVLVCDQNLDSFIAAFGCKSGREIWRTPRTEATSGHCTPIVYRPDGGPPQILAAGSFNLTSYDPATGKKLWWVGGLCFEMKSTPVMTNDTVYVNGFGSPQNAADQTFEIANFKDVVASKDANGDGGLSMAEMPDDLAKNFFSAVDLDRNKSLDEKEWTYFQNSIASKNSLMAIRLGGQGDMTEKNTLWKYHKNIPQLPSPVLVGDQILMISDRGILTSLNSKTGKEQYKGRIAGASGNYYASPVVAGNKIIFANTKGKLSVVNAGDELDVLSVCDLGEEIYATPAIVAGRVYVRTVKTLFCFGTSN